MTYKPIYLEPDEEITSVIDKIASSPDQEIALVLAKNSGLFQSLVNLKLLAKEAKKQGKSVALVTTNKIGGRLAGQVGIKTYGAIAAIPSTPQPLATAQPPVNAEPDQIINGVKVQQYDPNRQHPEIVADDQALEAELSQDESAPNAEEGRAEPEPQEFKPITVAAEPPAEKPEPVAGKVDDLPIVMSRSGGFSTRSEFKIPWKSVGVGFGILLLVLLLAYVLVPRAVVTVTFLAEPLSEKITLSAVADLKEQTNTALTGNKLTVEKTKTEKITATGKKDVGTKAIGTVTVTNKYTDGSGVGKDQTFSAGTKVTASSSKKVFTLDQSITVGKVTYDPNNGQPIYKSKSVGVTAVSPGEDYNIAAGSFSVAGALANTPTASSQAFSGGLTKVVTVLSQDNVDSALLELNKQAKEEAVKELETKAAGQKILGDAVWADIKQEDTDKEVGSEVSTATATLIVEYGTIAFSETDAIAKFVATFDNRITGDEQVVFPEDDKPDFTTKKITTNKNQLTFEISGTAFKVPKIDKARISNSVKNKSTEAAAAMLITDYDAESVETVISPSWWVNRLPLLAKEIRVEYGFIDKPKVDADNTDQSNQ